MFLNSINRLESADRLGFPFDLPLIEAFDSLQFESPVTILVGENGCGKSTLLEAIACGMQCHAISSGDPATDPAFLAARNLAQSLRFSRSKTPRTRLLFRAEDATLFSRHVSEELQELDAVRQEYEDNLEGYGRILATGSAAGQHDALANRYGQTPDACSHGEWFLTLLRTRIHRAGLYILDEPETPMSPIHQLSLLSIIGEAVAEGAQFIIATHSPVLMACPDAQLLEFDDTSITPVDWQDVEHVKLLKAFMKDPESFLRHL